MRYLTAAKLGTAVPLIGLALVLAGCIQTEEEAALPAGGSPAEPSQAAITSPTATPPPDPFITETGIRAEIIVDGPLGSGTNVCEADAEVYILNGAVVAVNRAPATFAAGAGEPVYRKDGTLASEPVFVSMPVNRSPDGKLQVGWRQCQFVPDSPEP